MEAHAPHAPSAPRRGAAQGPRLEPGQLLALQLHARGYSLRQLETLLSASHAGDVAALLQGAAEALGVRTVPAAIAEAKRRGLVV